MGVFKDMKELELKYGCNPNQRPARIFMREGELPITVLNGKPGYINFLDALNAWQLVKELRQATGLPAAASFKHVSPAGAALGLPLDDTLKKMYFVEDIELSPLACAYACARGADRMSSFGDWIALSDECDEATAKVIQHEVSDGVIAPGYSAAALAILKTKRKGGYNIVAIDPSYQPVPVEHKDVFGITFEQGRNELKFGDDTFSNIVTRTSRAASTVRALRATKRTSGSCATTPRCWACRSVPTSPAPTATTPSTCISPTNGRTCWATACGRRPSPHVPNR